MKLSMAIGLLVVFAASTWADEANTGTNRETNSPPTTAPTQTNAGAKTEPPRIRLQGFGNECSTRVVLFKTTMALCPGDAPKEWTFVLSEGESQGQVKVLKIDSETKTAKFLNHGQEQELSPEKDPETKVKKKDESLTQAATTDSGDIIEKSD